ncbi:hypothetical protein ABZ883_04845 [Streptomyces sp. NPDC046977]|uniref:hypothetical protein n=1 Tax=Streptomyces sp. NPDC046977 TaxID=3154703 RepID=UPI0033F7A532
MHSPLGWTHEHPVRTAAILLAVTLLVGFVDGWRRMRRVRAQAAQSVHPDAQPTDSRDRTPAAILVAAMAAAGCTAYSGDTSWRFAEDHLGMHSFRERIFLFGAAELALLACALMAQRNLRTRATPGAPGILVWVITMVQVIPAYTETTDIWGGTVRAFVGPVLAAVLCHLALGLDLWHAKPGALSASLPAVILRELRERLLSRLGLAVRGRDAEQISRDRATAAAVRLAARLEHTRRFAGFTRRRLAAAVARAQVGQDPEQRQQLLAQLAARRTADELATMPVTSPWAQPGPARPATVRALAHQALTRMQPIDAVRTVAAAHPHASLGEVASLCTAAGVVVSEAQVRIALGLGNPPAPDPGDARETLLLDLAPMPDPHPAVVAAAVAAPSRAAAVHARIPATTTVEDAQPDALAAETGAQPDADAPDPDADAPDPDADACPANEDAVDETDELLEEALRLDDAIRAGGGRNASRGATLRILQRELRIGQARAQRLQRLITKAKEQQ